MTAVFSATTTAAAPKEMFLQMFLTHVHTVPAPHLVTEFSVVDNGRSESSWTSAGQGGSRLDDPSTI